MTDEVIVGEGIRRGHEVHVVLPRFPAPPCDLTVVSCTLPLSRGGLDELESYVVYLHDFSPLCHHGLLYPMADRCKRCENRDWTLRFLKRAKLVGWMSPLHREAWLHALPEPEFVDHPNALIPSAFSPGQVEQLKRLRGSQPDERTVLGVNSLHSFKGKAAVLEYARKHPELRFTFVGGHEGEPSLPPNAVYAGPQPAREMLCQYARHERVIHLPYLDPCSRITAEALLAGRKMIYNKAIGLLSYFKAFPSPEEVERLVLGSAPNFWNRVEGVMK